MAVPYTFGSATSSIPLSQLDSNFATGITLGNTTVYLGNTTTSFGNVTLTNVTISSVSTAITPSQGGTGLVTIPANNVILGNGTSNVTVVAPGTSGNVLTSNGTTWSSSTISAASVSAAGSTTQVQYNNGGAFAGSANLTFNGTTLTAAGLSGPHDGTVGATTPNTGSFTTLAASSTVSGTGFSTYLASPPAIGSTAANTGAFTTLTTSSTVTLNGGTANGVTYLNGSKVLTSGSALTFDGTNLSASYGIKVNTTGTVTSGFVNAVNVGTWDALGYDSGGTDVVLGGYRASQFGAISFYAAGSQQMRLTSTGLGIGTSSPGASTKLNVAGRGLFTGGAADPSDSTSAGVAINYNGTTGFIGAIQTGVAVKPLFVYGNNLIFGGSPTSEFMRIDSAGNLGLGVTPSAWGLGRAFDVSTGSTFWNVSNSETQVLNNTYHNGTNFIYKNTSTASRYRMNGASHEWYSAASGTAGTNISFTQAMTLDASGNLGIGVTSPATPLHVYGGSNVSRYEGSSTSQPTYQTFYNGSADKVYFGIENSSGSGIIGTGAAYGMVLSTASTNPLVFGTNATERARIDSSGNLLVGATSGTTYRAQFVCGDQYAILGYNTNSAKAVGDIWNAATTGDNKFFNFLTEANGTQRGSITYNRGAGLVAYNVTSDYRAKDISGPVTNSGALIDSVPVYMGKMKGATQERPMFIAHETPAYAHTGEKDAVDADGNPVYQQMDASALIPVMWAEIQSLRQRVAQLETN